MGIGFAIARRLALLGADLFAHSFTPFDQAAPWGADPGGIETVLAELRQTGRRVAHLEADFMLPESPRRLLEAAAAEFVHQSLAVIDLEMIGIQPYSDALADETRG